jgi:hypothetical protein
LSFKKAILFAALALACSSGPSSSSGKLNLPIPSLEEGRKKQSVIRDGQMLWQLDPEETVRTYAADLGITEQIKAGDMRTVKNEPMLATVELDASGYNTTRVYLAKLLDAPENRPTLWFIVAVEKAEKKKEKK